MNLDGLEYLGELTDGGYVWEKVYYDLNKKEFVKDKFHCGSVDDCAEFYDGRETVPEKELIAKVWNEPVFLCNILKYVENDYTEFIKELICSRKTTMVKLHGDKRIDEARQKHINSGLVGDSETEAGLTYYEVEDIVCKYSDYTGEYYRYQRTQNNWIQDDDVLFRMVGKGQILSFDLIYWKNRNKRKRFEEIGKCKYVITFVESGNPYLVNDDFFLMYSDQSNAMSYIGKLIERYGDGSLEVSTISDIQPFFETMVKKGISSFMLNEEKELYSIYSVCEKYISQPPKQRMEQLKSQIIDKQNLCYIQNNKDTLPASENSKLGFQFGIVTGVIALFCVIVSLLFVDSWDYDVVSTIVMYLSFLNVLCLIPRGIYFSAKRGKIDKFITKTRKCKVFGVVLSIIALILSICAIVVAENNR